MHFEHRNNHEEVRPAYQPDTQQQFAIDLLGIVDNLSAIIFGLRPDIADRNLKDVLARLRSASLVFLAGSTADSAAVIELTRECRALTSQLEPAQLLCDSILARIAQSADASEPLLKGRSKS